MTLSTLGLTNYDEECSGVTAEITPHLRPIDWDVLGTMNSKARGK